MSHGRTQDGIGPMPDERDLSERELRRPAGMITQAELERVFNARRHWKGRAEAAEAEVERLREALKDAADDLDAAAAIMRADGSMQNSHIARDDAKRARAALSPRDDRAMSGGK